MSICRFLSQDGPGIHSGFGFLSLYRNLENHVEEFL